MTETVSLSGSGLVFVNTYEPGVTAAYQTAILTAENFLQSHFVDAVTVTMDFDLQPLGSQFVAQNSYSPAFVSYASLVAALRSHAVTPDDALALGGLPASDPSHGIGFSVPVGEARVLGLAGPAFGIDDSITLSSSAGFMFGQDAVGALEHEITEGIFGRVGSLGITSGTFSPMDLFRFTASGVRDFTGGADGQATFFGVDGTHLTTFAFHNSVSVTGLFDGFDLADWNSRGDAFGNTGPSAPGVVSLTDLRVLDVLGWTPANASSGQVLAGATGGDTLQAGAGNDTVLGGASGANYLRGNAGADSISGGAQFDDINGNMGNDTAHGNAGDDWVVGGKDSDLLFGDAGNDLVYGNLGSDTLDGGDGNDTVRGGQGDDSLSGGAGNDYISGDLGNDTESGGSGADLFHTWKDAGIDKVLDFHLSEGDRVMLDPGTAYTVSQVGADTVIDMGGGNQMILVGVQLSTLTSGWIFEG